MIVMLDAGMAAGQFNGIINIDPGALHRNINQVLVVRHLAPNTAR
ncbi:MAG: hypothetical protein R2865_08995 [Deinococcales bacterium]